MESQTKPDVLAEGSGVALRLRSDPPPGHEHLVEHELLVLAVFDDVTAAAADVRCWSRCLECSSCMTRLVALRAVLRKSAGQAFEVNTNRVWDLFQQRRVVAGLQWLSAGIAMHLVQREAGRRQVIRTRGVEGTSAQSIEHQAGDRSLRLTPAIVSEADRTWALLIEERFRGERAPEMRVIIRQAGLALEGSIPPVGAAKLGPLSFSRTTVEIESADEPIAWIQFEVGSM